MKAIVGQKVGMTQTINEDGSVTPVTIVSTKPGVLTQVKTLENDGYNALQIGFGTCKESDLSKPVAGHVKPSKATPKTIVEFRPSTDDFEAPEVGASFNTEQFEVGDKVTISSTSKGKGFAGTVKRWNFNTSARSHGGNGVVRRAGSIGSMYPQKVFKGKKMAGQMGNDKVTLRNIEVVLVDATKNIIGLKGPVPGPKKTQVTIRGEA